MTPKVPQTPQADSYQCGSHEYLVETLGGIKSDLRWFKKAFWSIPMILVVAGIAFASFIVTMDNRLTVCETKLSARR